MPNWKKVITSGSSANLNNITVSGNISGSGTSTGSFGHLMVGGETFSYSYVYFSGDPTCTGGVISNIQYEANTSPDEHIVTEFTSDVNNITVGLEIHSNGNPWQPISVIVSGGGASPVTVLKQHWSQAGSGRSWTATANLIDASDGTDDPIVATLSDGDTATCTYIRALDPPEILTAVIDNNPGSSGGDAECPAAQTQVKSGDTVYISGTAELHADEVHIKSSNLTSTTFSTTNVNGAGEWSTTITAGGGSSDSTAHYTCYAKVTGGTNGPDYPSDESIDLSQTTPTLTSATVNSYPTDQYALKGSETADVTITRAVSGTTGDTYVYSDNGQSELSIPSTTTYSATKTVTRDGGSYRVSGNNYKLIAKRTTKNGATTTKYATVKISTAAPILSMVGATSRLRSDDSGTQTYALTMTAKQSSGAYMHIQAFNCERDAADSGDIVIPTWSGTASGDATWTSNIQVKEADPKNLTTTYHTFSSVLATGLSGLTTTTIGTYPNYTIGGFGPRTLSFAPYVDKMAIGTQVSNKSNATKLSCVISGLGAFTYAVNTTPAVGKFTITDAAGNFDADGTYLKILDSAVINVGTTYSITIEEIA